MVLGVWCLVIGVQCLGFRVLGLGFGVWDLVFRVWSMGFEDPSPERASDASACMYLYSIVFNFTMSFTFITLKPRVE